MGFISGLSGFMQQFIHHLHPLQAEEHLPPVVMLYLLLCEYDNKYS